MSLDIIVRHVEAIKKSRLSIEILDHNGQCFVLVRELVVPSPPWDKHNYDILIAIPAEYNMAALDGFYLGLPYKFQEGTHPRVNGAVISIRNSDWQLVSWHYPDGKPWRQGMDTLETHITHCKGFFLHRGANNAYR